MNETAYRDPRVGDPPVRSTYANGTSRAYQMLKRLEGWMENEYGSRRGFAHHVQWRVLTASRLYRVPRVDWQRVERLIFVCSGNICRSPLAAVRARAHGLNARSAGTSCDAGYPPDPRLLAFAAERGIAAITSISTPLEQVDLAASDLIIGMEPIHLQAKALQDATCQKSLLGLWLRWPRPCIYDPYCSSSRYFNRCGNLIIEAVDALAEDAGR